MKKILLVIVLGFIFNSVYAQGIYGNLKTGSAYQSINVESKNTYNIRRSHNRKEGYSTYEGSKSYVRVDFIRKNGDRAFSFYQNGSMYDWIRNLSGSYFVANECGYKSYKIYIRWDHGGEAWGFLDYSERSDGRPKLHIYISGDGYVYSPYVN